MAAAGSSEGGGGGAAAAAAADDRASIFIAISSGKVNRLHSLLSNVEDLNVRDTSLRTPLIHAVFISSDDIRTHVLRLLLRHGCDVNAQDGMGRTALMYACMERDKMDAVRLLAKCRRCDPNLQDNDGSTALIHAVEGGNAAALRILTSNPGMKGRVKVNTTNKQGISPIEMSIKLGLADCCRILIRDGGADTTMIKNRHMLMDLLNENRSQTPFESSSTPGLEDMDFNLSLTPRPGESWESWGESSPRDSLPRTRESMAGGRDGGGFLTHRSDDQSYIRTSSRNASGPGTPRPGSDFPASRHPLGESPHRLVLNSKTNNKNSQKNNSPRNSKSKNKLESQSHGNFALTHNNFTPNTTKSKRDSIGSYRGGGGGGVGAGGGGLVGGGSKTYRPVSRDFHLLDNPFLEMVRQDSGLYVPNSRTTFRRSIVKTSPRKNSLERRPLTPITTRSEDSRVATPVRELPLPRSRLPSIPSGRGMITAHGAAAVPMLSPCDTPTGTVSPWL